MRAERPGAGDEGSATTRVAAGENSVSRGTPPAQSLDFAGELLGGRCPRHKKRSKQPVETDPRGSLEARHGLLTLVGGTQPGARPVWLRQA